jgi:CDP-diacylglycerol--serine O-phosphatidyltransferase
VILVYFVCCGVSRLARYNVTAEQLSAGSDKVAYFEGTPIPTSVLLTAVLAFAAWQGASARLYGGAGACRRPAASAGAAVRALGTLMVSKTLRIPKL